MKLHGEEGTKRISGHQVSLAGRMSEQVKNQGPDNGQMHRREITLEDGRYMIFYTFGDEESPAENEKQNDQREDV